MCIRDRLNLEHHHAAAQGMHRSSGQEDRVAWLGSKVCKLVRHRSLRERPPHIVRGCPRLQAGIDTAFRPRLQHHPSFRFPALTRRQQVHMRIRGMHLHREHFPCVQELQQQWESAPTVGQSSQHLLGVLIQQFADRAPRQRSVRNAAGMVFAVAQYPRFADRSIARQRLR